jgi:RNA recognition motif-containing protein
MIDKNTNHPRGFGFITLKNEEKVSEVLCTQPHYICGKKVTCKKEKPKELLGNGKRKLKKKKKPKEKEALVIHLQVLKIPINLLLYICVKCL